MELKKGWNISLFSRSQHRVKLHLPHLARCFCPTELCRLLKTSSMQALVWCRLTANVWTGINPHTQVGGKSENRKTARNITLCVLSWRLSWCSCFFFFLEKIMELFDFLIIVLPLWNNTHCCLQLGLFGHWVITLQRKHTNCSNTSWINKLYLLNRGMLPPSGTDGLLVNFYYKPVFLLD